MKKQQYALASRLMRSLKESWRKTNPDANKVLDYLKNKYGELPRPDHLAIRSISGIGFGHEEAYRLFSALGYRYGGSWWIPNLHIAACHFEPPVPELEKVFFSVVLIEEFGRDLSIKNYKKLKECIALCAAPVDGYFMEDLINRVQCFHEFSRQQRERAVDLLQMFFNQKNHKIADHAAFEWLSARPQFQELAHVLAYGFIPNHFTLLLKDPHYAFSGYTTMEAFAEEIKSLGIQMKEKAEGAEESLLCQTSTKAHKGPYYDWPMSYIEFIRRGKDHSSPTGRYEGFVPNQAQALFKMTSKK